MNICRIFINAYSVSVKDMINYSFYYVNVVSYIKSFPNIKPTLHSWYQVISLPGLPARCICAE